MKTTIDLPDSLASEIRQRAQRQGREFNDIVVELVAAGMPPKEGDSAALFAKTLPVIKALVVPSGERLPTPQEFSDSIQSAELNLEAER